MITRTGRYITGGYRKISSDALNRWKKSNNFCWGGGAWASGTFILLKYVSSVVCLPKIVFSAFDPRVFIWPSNDAQTDTRTRSALSRRKIREKVEQ